MKYIYIRLISGLKFIEFDDVETGKPCLKTSQGFKGCKLFLSNIEVVNEILEIEASDRIYRDMFTNNYKALFPYPKKRFYRVDVLEASLEGYTSIWVNGEKFEFNSGVIQTGKELNECWICLITLIFQIKDLIEERIRKNENIKIFVFEDELWKANIVNVLKKFDQSWVEFEKEYIMELISIESVARRFIINLHKYIIDNKILMCDMGGRSLESDNEATSIQEMQREEKLEDSSVENGKIESRIQCSRMDQIFFELVKSFYRVLNLNNKYNNTENINLSTWEQIVQINELAAKSPHSCFSVVGALSMQCMSEMTMLLEQVVDACKVPEKIDPHICNNLSLQQQILRVEETWGIARKQFSKLVSMEEDDVNRLSLVQLVKLFQRVFSIQFNIRRRIRRVEPGMAMMELDSANNSEEKYLWENIFVEKLEECDVVALLALPKICCILYLMNPGICSDMITQFLNNERAFELQRAQPDDTGSIEVKLIRNQFFKSVNLSSNASSCEEKMQDETCSVQSSFLNMVSLWNSFTQAVFDHGDLNLGTSLLDLETGVKILDKEQILLVYIFSLLTGICFCGGNIINNCRSCTKETKMIQENGFIKATEKLLNSLLISIEEVSILLQRVSASEWNEFIQTAVICITKSPIILEEIVDADNNTYLKENEIEKNHHNFDDKSSDSSSISSDNSNSNTVASSVYGNKSKQQEAHFFALNNTKIHSFLSNIGSIIYESVKSYGKFTANSNSVTQESSDNTETITYSCSNSNFDNSTDI